MSRRKPRSLELFSHLKIIDEVKKQGIPIPLVRSYEMPDGQAILKEFSMSPPLEPTPQNPFVSSKTRFLEAYASVLLY
jgi:hypothetical protein